MNMIQSKSGLSLSQLILGCMNLPVEDVTETEEIIKKQKYEEHGI